MAILNQDQFDKISGEVKIVETPKTTITEPKGKTDFGDIIEKRGTAIKETWKDVITKPIGEGIHPVEVGVQTAGAVAGGLTDMASEVINWTLKQTWKIIPDLVKKPIEEVGKDILNTPAFQKGIELAQKGIEYYQGWKDENPRVAKDLESVVNIGVLLSYSRVAQKVGVGIKKDIGKVAGKLAPKLEESAIKNKGVFVRELVKPVETKSILESQVPRTTEKGVGLFKKSIIKPTPKELNMEKEVMKIPGIDPKKTMQQNYNLISDANFKEANLLKTSINNNDFIFPKKELKFKLQITKNELMQNPLITGDASKTASKLITKVDQMIDEVPAKGSSLLKLRKEYDNWISSQKGTGIFDPAKENALSIANREIRHTINNFLIDKSINVPVKASLRKQAILFDAMENLVPKAAIEANTAFGRLLQNSMELLGIKSKIVQDIAAAVGIGGLGAAAYFAPPVAVIGGTGLLVYKAGKMIMNPSLHLRVASLLKTLENNFKNIPAAMNLLKEDMSVVKDLLSTGIVAGKVIEQGIEDEEEIDNDPLGIRE